MPSERNPSVSPPSPPAARDPSTAPLSPTPAERNPSVSPPSPPAARDPSMDPPSPAAQSELSPASSPAVLQPKSKQQPQSKQYKAYTIPEVQPSRKQQRKKKEMDPAEVEPEDPVKTFFQNLKAKRVTTNKKLEIDPVGKAHFVKECIPKLKKKETDYNRQLRKLYSNPANRITAKLIPQLRPKSNPVPQFGEQSKQSIPPLIVHDRDIPSESTDPLTLADMVVQTDLTKAQFLGHKLQETRGKKKFVLGEPLIWPELLKYLPTRMAELHKWYAVHFRNGMKMFPARIKDEHLWRGADDVWVEFVALYDLYHQDALHKCLMSVWIMQKIQIYRKKTTTTSASWIPMLYTRRA
ncbi:unnamed protein product [Urochloa humidicola]